MKILLTIFVLLFSNIAMSQKVDGDILYFLKKGYKIVSVVSAEEGLITYILNYNDQKIIHCTTNIYGSKLFCFSLEE